MFNDMSLEELRAYAPQRVEPADFDEFWGAPSTRRARRRYPRKWRPSKPG